MDAKVVVLGRNYTSRLGMIRAAGEAGFSCAVIHVKNAANREDYDRHSKYVAEYHTVNQGEDEKILELLTTLGRGAAEKPVLLPTDDYSAYLIDHNLNRLRDLYLTPSAEGGQDAVLRLMDKDVQKELAAAAGLPVARGWTLRLVNGAWQIPSDLVYPCFVKSQVSINGVKKFMKKCASRQDLEQHLFYIRDLVKTGETVPEILVEQFLPIEQEYAVLGLVLDQQVIVPGFIEMGLDHLGVTATGTLRPAADFAETAEKIKAMLRALHFTGLVDVDLCRANNQMYFIELNVRFGASGYATTGAGVNLPEMLIHFLREHKNPAEPPEIRARSFASEKVCFQEYSVNHLTWKQYRALLKEADFTFLRNEADPGPYQAFEKYARKRRLRKTVGRLLGRGK